jgi:predicted nuclease with TOPRIM domain
MAVDLFHALYDALLRINVPSDRARTVIEAMERDMASTLATKGDLLSLKGDFTALRGEFAALKDEFAALRGEFAALKNDFATLRGEFAALKGEFALLKSDVARLDERMDARLMDIRYQIELQKKSLIIWLGSAQVVASGLLFTALSLLR